MAEKFGDRVVIADDDAVEAGLSAQPVAQQGDMRGHRYAGDIVERRHDRRAAGRDGGLKRRQIDFMQAALGHVGRGVIAPRERRAIGAESASPSRRRCRRRKDRVPGSRAPWPRRSATPPRDPRPALRRSAPSADRARRRSSARRSLRSPSRAASMAATRAVRSQRTGSKAAASASGIGKIVRCPWTTSKPSSSGTPSRDSSTAIRWIARAGSAPQRLSMLPIRPARMPSVTSPASTGPVTA